MFHGAAARVDPAATAFANRVPHHVVEVIAVWPPGLNEKRNSQLGALALERLATAAGWSVFEPQRD